MAETKLKLQFLEQENQLLIQEKTNLQQTLNINKQLLNSVLSSVDFKDEQLVIDSLNEELDQLTMHADTLAQERQELGAKVLILEQVNLDLQNKASAQAEEFFDQEHLLSQKLQAATFLADIRQKYFQEMSLLLSEVSKQLPAKVRSEVDKKYEQLLASKARADQPGQF